MTPVFDTLFPPEIGTLPDSMPDRLVITHDGRIAYISDRLAAMIHAQPAMLRGCRLDDLLVLCDPEQALGDAPLAAEGQHPAAHWCTMIVAGIHAVEFRDRREEPITLEFSWMQVGNGARYLVATRVLPTPYQAPKLSHVPAALYDPAIPSLDDAVARMHGVANDQPIDDVPVAPTTPPAPIKAAANDDHAARLADDSNDWTGEEGPAAAPRGMVVIPSARAAFAVLPQKLARPTPRLTPVTQPAAPAPLLAQADPATDHELQRLKQQLAETEALAHLGYWRWPVGSTAMTWSDEIYRIFGVTRDGFAPTLITVEPMIRKRDRLRIIQVFERAMIDQNTYQLEFSMTRPDGQACTLLCQGRCERDQSGDVAALYGIIQDVTGARHNERELIKAKNAAERAYASKSKFLANMSHELRTPLNAIIGFSEMMQRQLLGPLGNPRYVEYLDGIRVSGEHLLDLISDILDMSKIEAGKYQLDVEDLNITKLARMAMGMIEGRAREARIALTTQGFETDRRVVADRRAMLQMMLNLLSNAIKFTEPGGTVTVRLEGDENAVRFGVRDTGIGIPAHILPMITKPFEQAANHYTRAHDGSGLGLAITKELINMHGGDLRLSSTVGVGTDVVIELPKGR